MDLRDWLIIGGVLALVIIIADGIRRVKKRGKLSLDIDNQFKDFPEVDLSSELPNGGARVATTLSPDQQGESEPQAKLDQTANDDVDLLLQGDFKGVGEGAHEWLKDSDGRQRVAPAEDNLVEKRQVDEPLSEEAFVQSAVAGTNRLSENYLDIPAAKQPKPYQQQSAQESGRREPDFADLDLLQADAESVLAEKNGSPEASSNSWESDFSGEGIISPVRVKKVEQPVSVPTESFEPDISELDPSTFVADPVASSAPQQDHSRPQVALVEESEEELDLSKPVTVLMDQMYGRSQPEPEQSQVASEKQAESVQVESVLTEPEKLISPESATEAPLSSDNQIDKDADALEAALESLGGV
ncbi:MAG: hypothetical protein OQK12_02335, partial [Motiliproteus sp.]|nr:hypothetical protein [Motiliproteus sp.]